MVLSALKKEEQTIKDKAIKQNSFIASASVPAPGSFSAWVPALACLDDGQQTVRWSKLFPQVVVFHCDFYRNRTPKSDT